MPAPRDADARWRRAAASLSPDLVLVAAMEITHPSIDDPIRAVNDGEQRTIEGEIYAPLRFGARLVSDVEGEVPRAEITMDNVGYELTRWLHATDGGSGARVRFMEVSIGAAVQVEWELSLRTHSMHAGERIVRAVIGFPRLHDLPAVVVRHDQARSPGLF